jgi:hypothetical protein
MDGYGFCALRLRGGSRPIRWVRVAFFHWIRINITRMSVLYFRVSIFTFCFVFAFVFFLLIAQRTDDRDRDRDREHRQQLSETEQAAWETTLRKLTCERASIRAAMVFALDHAEAAKAMVATWVDALTLPETPIPKKLARLYLVSGAWVPKRDAIINRNLIERMILVIIHRSPPHNSAFSGRELNHIFLHNENSGKSMLFNHLCLFLV